MRVIWILIQVHPYGARSAPIREGVVGGTAGSPTGRGS